MSSAEVEVILFQHAANFGAQIKEAGILVLSNIQLCFTGFNGVKYELAWPNVADAKFAPASANVAAMKVRGTVGNTEEAVIELTGASVEENIADLAIMRELVKELRFPTKKLRSLISMKKRQLQLLAADREIAKKHHQLVEHNKILTEEEFWNSHRGRLHDFELEVESKRMKKGHHHVRSAIIELVEKSKKTEDGKFIIDLSEDLKLKIFARYPQVRRDFETHVPVISTEMEFWNKYITRELFRNFENESKYNKFVNADDNHIATGTYTGNIEGIHSHIGSRPSQTSSANLRSFATTSSSVASMSDAAAHNEVRETLEHAKKRRKFDSAHAVAEEIDLTSTYNDYVREARMDTDDNIIVSNNNSEKESKQNQDLPQVIIQQLNEEGFASLLTHEEEAKRAKRVEGFHKHHHHQKNHHKHRNHHQTHKENNDNSSNSLPAETRGTSAIAIHHGTGYEDMDEVLHALPHRPKVDSESVRLEKRLLELHQPTNQSSSAESFTSSLRKAGNPAGLAFESAMNRLQILFEGKVYDSAHQKFSATILPSKARAAKSLDIETQRLQRQALEWEQHRKTISEKSTNQSSFHHHHHHLNQQAESAEEAQYQQDLLGYYIEIAELLLHFYGLLDRLKDLRGDLANETKSRTAQAVSDKISNIMNLLQRKEDALKRKKQQLQPLLVSSSSGTISASSLALEGVVKMLEEMLSQIQRAKSWVDHRRQFSEELY
jgi:hypothetical protein